MSVDLAFVARTLDAARRAHVSYRQFVPHMRSGTGPSPIQQAGESTQAQQWLAEAVRLRTEADAADPDHTSPEWAKDNHAELMAYYAHVSA